MKEKRIALIGAGKLGKGYVADLFGKAGYALTFMARRQAQVDTLRVQGYYTVLLEHENGAPQEIYRVSGFEVLCTEGPERAACVEVLSKVEIASIQIYDNGFAAVGELLAEAIARRAQAGYEAPLNILLVVNYPASDEIFDGLIRSHLTTSAQVAYYETWVGLIKTLAYRGGFGAPAELLAEDPEAICASDYPELAVDQEAWKGELAEVPGVVYLDQMHHRLKAKLWGGNMRGSAMGSFAWAKGYRMSAEMQADPEVVAFSQACYEEAVQGILYVFDMTYEDYVKGERKVIPRLPEAGPRVNTDSISREIFGIARKIGRQERLVGGAVACMESGRLPENLAKAVAYMMMVDNPADPSSAEVRAAVAQEGISAAVTRFCSLDPDHPVEGRVHAAICAAYQALNA